MYRLNRERNLLEEITETTFYESNLKERQHIEEWLRKNPEIMGEELLIIGHEYDDFENNERIDLLAIDKEGNLVVIEVKRDNSGISVDFQALKYVSYMSRRTLKEIIEIYSKYIDDNSLQLDPIQEIMEFLNVDDESLLNDMINNTQRIIIIGKELDKRVLSVCAWLYENGINVKCISIKPYKYNEEIFIDTNQIIPPEKIEEYYINKKSRTSNQEIKSDNKVIKFLSSIVENINSMSNLNIKYPGKRYYLGAYNIKNANISFCISYSKRNAVASISAESSKKDATDILKRIFNEKEDYISKELGIKVSLESGIRNENVYRLLIRKDIDDTENLLKYSSFIAEKFIEFKNIIENEVKIILNN
ncbi:endonuclease NucS domain-containing protein [Clostridium sp.]|uniref:endonuclease NucS domain-containing protein n=1 Tax=Clostridium sp. TaxID=1506 RepID=UPI0039918FCB